MKPSPARSLSPWFAVALMAAAPAAAAADRIDAANSRVTATFRQMNVPVEGRFTSFRGTIRFDPKNAAAASARIEIDTASFDLGAPEYNDELHKPEWFDTLHHPKATFESSSVVALGPDRFEARGKLTLKGKTRDIQIPFTQRSEAGGRVYEGELPISRKTYAIGSAEWDDTLEDQVIVKFRIITTR